MKNKLLILNLIIILFSISAFSELNDNINKTKFKQLEKHKNTNIVIMYFSPNCGHCRRVLPTIFDKSKRKNGVEYIGIISNSATPEIYKNFIDTLSIKGISIYHDNKMIFKKERKLRGVPAIFVFDKSGKCLYAKSRFSGKTIEDILEIKTNILQNKDAFKKVKSKYYSSDICLQCHKTQKCNWNKSKHRNAFRSMTKKVKNMSFKNLEKNCTSCHSTGYGKPTGFNSISKDKHLLNIGCESCHSKAGPHDNEYEDNMDSRCLECHTREKDPNFNLEYSKLKLLGIIKE